MRETFKKALAKQLDWPDRIVQGWLQFEREFGTVSSYYDAYSRIKQALALSQKRQAKASVSGQNSIPHRQPYVQQHLQVSANLIQASSQSSISQTEQQQYQLQNQSAKRKHHGAGDENPADVTPSVKRAKTEQDATATNSKHAEQVDVKPSKSNEAEEPIPDEDYKIIDK